MSDVLKGFISIVGIATFLTIIFVNPQKTRGGVSGGTQASNIINSAGESISKILTSAQGGGVM